MRNLGLVPSKLGGIHPSGLKLDVIKSLHTLHLHFCCLQTQGWKGKGPAVSKSGL